MKRIILCLLLLVLSESHPLLAMGLGPIEIKSTLNQPLNAEIQLLDLRAISLADIKVSLASEQELTRAGIESLPVLSTLTFDVLKNEHGVPVIKVMTSEPLDEPYIRFMLDVAWPDGQFFRVYTALLDPSNQPQSAISSKRPHMVEKATKHRLESQHSTDTTNMQTRLPEYTLQAMDTDTDNDSEEEFNKINPATLSQQAKQEKPLTVSASAQKNNRIEESESMLAVMQTLKSLQAQVSEIALKQQSLSEQIQLQSTELKSAKAEWQTAISRLKQVKDEKLPEQPKQDKIKSDRTDKISADNAPSTLIKQIAFVSNSYASIENHEQIMVDSANNGEQVAVDETEDELLDKKQFVAQNNFQRKTNVAASEQVNTPHKAAVIAALSATTTQQKNPQETVVTMIGTPNIESTVTVTSPDFITTMKQIASKHKWLLVTTFFLGTLLASWIHVRFRQRLLAKLADAEEPGAKFTCNQDSEEPVAFNERIAVEESQSGTFAAKPAVAITRAITSSDNRDLSAAQAKLELAKTFFNVGNVSAACSILEEVSNQGSEGQQLAAQKMLSQIKEN